MIQRMQNIIPSFFITENFQRPIGNHFVRIHIRRCPRAALNDIDNEFAVEFSGCNFVTCLTDGISKIFLEQSEFTIGYRSGFFN